MAGYALAKPKAHTNELKNKLVTLGNVSAEALVDTIAKRLQEAKVKTPLQTLNH